MAFAECMILLFSLRKFFLHGKLQQLTIRGRLVAIQIHHEQDEIKSPFGRMAAKVPKSQFGFIGRHMHCEYMHAHMHCTLSQPGSFHEIIV